jgi:hypothetical protein
MRTQPARSGRLGRRLFRAAEVVLNELEAVDTLRLEAREVPGSLRPFNNRLCRSSAEFSLSGNTLFRLSPFSLLSLRCLPEVEAGSAMDSIGMHEVVAGDEVEARRVVHLGAGRG